MSDNKITKLSHKREIANKRKEIEQAIATIAEVNLQWGLSKKAPTFTYKAEEYTPVKIDYLTSRAKEILGEFEALVAPNRTNSVTTKTKPIAKELVNFVSDPKASFGKLTVDGQVQEVAPLLYSLRKGNTCHRVVNTALMHYASVNGLNKSTPKPAGGKSAPSTRSSTDELMRKYIGKYIDQAGKDKGFSALDGFPTFNTNSIASELFIGDEVAPGKEELAAYTDKLDELKGDTKDYSLTAYIDALAAVSSPSEALIDYANVLHDVAVLDLSKEYSNKAKKDAAPPKKAPAKGGRGAKKADAEALAEPPQETESSVKEDAPATPAPVAKPATKPATVRPAATLAKPAAAPRAAKK